MRDEPSPELSALLHRLQLVTPDQLQSVRSPARRLGRDWPLLDSIWIDALARKRLLTPFQAAELTAGRGEQLRVGPYLLRQRLQRLGYADSFLAATIVDNKTPEVTEPSSRWKRVTAKVRSK